MPLDASPRNRAPGGLLNRFLNVIEWSGNKLPDPIIIFAALCALTLVASAVAGLSGWSAVHPGTGETLVATNLLSTEGMRVVIGDAAKTFGAFAPLASFAMFHMVTVFPLSWVFLFTKETPVRFLLIEAFAAVFGIAAIIASGHLADRFGRRTVLGVSAAAIAAFSGFAPQLLGAGQGGELAFMLTGFVLLGLSFGQSSGAISASFPIYYRYTGSALTSDLAWMFGAGFAPLAALLLSSEFGLISSGAYLLSGAAGTLAALWLNQNLARRIE